MNSNDVAGRLETYPPERPKRRFTVSDVSLIVGTGLLVSVGSFAAGMGHLTGMLFSIVAALGVITVRSSRAGRVNEPALEKFTGPLSIGVSVFTIVYTFGMWRNSVMTPSSSVILSVIPLTVYAGYVAIMFRPRRRSHE